MFKQISWLISDNLMKFELSIVIKLRCIILWNLRTHLTHQFMDHISQNLLSPICDKTHQMMDFPWKYSHKLLWLLIMLNELLLFFSCLLCIVQDSWQYWLDHVTIFFSLLFLTRHLSSFLKCHKLIWILFPFRFSNTGK